MKNLITIENKNAVVELSTIVKFSENNEKSVRDLVLKYEEELFAFGLPTSTNLKLPRSASGVNVTWSKVKLTEEQVYFILTLLDNTENVVKFKHELIKQFFSMREQISSIREQALIEASQNELKFITDIKDKEIARIKIESKKLNDYNGFISVSKFTREIFEEKVTATFMWEALEYAGWLKSVEVKTVERRLDENCSQYIGRTIPKTSTPIYTEVALREAYIKYVSYLANKMDDS